MTSTPFSFNSCLVCFIAFSFSAFKPALQYGGLKNINIITIKHALGISAWENQVWWNSKLQWKRTKKCFLFLKHLTSDCNLCFVLTSFSSLFCCSLLSDWSCESCESYWERSFVRASSSRLYEKQRKSYQSLSPAIHVIAAELKLWTTYRLRRFSPKSLSSSELRKQSTREHSQTLTFFSVCSANCLLKDSTSFCDNFVIVSICELSLPTSL